MNDNEIELIWGFGKLIFACIIATLAIYSE
jgi:hypothetical protein